MGWARGTCEGYRNAYGALVGKLRENNRLDDLEIDGRKLLKFALKKIGWEGFGWIDLARDRSKWRTVLDAVMNLRAS